MFAFVYTPSSSKLISNSIGFPHTEPSSHLLPPELNLEHNLPYSFSDFGQNFVPFRGSGVLLQ